MMTRMAFFFISTVLVLASFAARAGAAVPAVASFAAVKAPRPLPLDPALGDPVWQSGALAVQGGFENLTTRHLGPLATDVSMLYDDRNLYVAFTAVQAGVPIIAAQSTNDVGFGLDDFVGVGVDTSGNGSQTYYFEATPRGVRYQQASENARYRPQWQAAAQISGTTWRAVFIIPLDVLRVRAASSQSWRINFIRNVAALGEHYTWAYDGIMQDGPIGQWPNFIDARYWPAWTGVTLRGRKDARPQPRLEVYGLDSGGRDRTLFQQADGSFRRQAVRPIGIDVSVPLDNTISFVGTLSPDFSNVEIDQQTIAPQEFRRGLQEYRPFFAQGANFINAAGAPFGGILTPQNSVFYSPGIGPFDRGAKVEGTFGLQSFGVLNLRGFDQTGGNTFDDFAYGYKHALQNRTFLYWADGVLAHHSLAGSDSTSEFGVAGRNLRTGFVYALDEALEHGTALGGGTPASARSSSGFLDVHKPNWEINLGYGDVTPNYNPIDGFTSDSDVRGFDGFADFNGSTHWLKNFAGFIGADRFMDRSGAVHQADFGAFLNATFKNGFSLDGAGPGISELRSYSFVNPADDAAAFPGGCGDSKLARYRSYFTGFPTYYCGRTDTYDLMSIPVGYRDGSPTPIDAAVTFGRFGFGLVGPGDNGPDYLHLYSLGTSRPLGRFLTLGVEYDGSFERAQNGEAFASQWLRRISLGAQLGSDTNLTLSLRSINGRGGFAPPGVNVAGAFHRRLRNGDELFLNFGTPAANSTIDRLILKYLFRFGAQAGT